MIQIIVSLMVAVFSKSHQIGSWMFNGKENFVYAFICLLELLYFEPSENDKIVNY